LTPEKNAKNVDPGIYPEIDYSEKNYWQISYAYCNITLFLHFVFSCNWSCCIM